MQLARQYKSRCEELSSQIRSAKKPQRDQISPQQPDIFADEEDAAPAKKPSPDNKPKWAVLDLVDSSDGASDDEVSPPIS